MFARIYFWNTKYYAIFCGIKQIFPRISALVPVGSTLCLSSRGLTSMGNFEEKMDACCSKNLFEQLEKINNNTNFVYIMYSSDLKLKLIIT
jgi:hypothetical protein